MVSRQTGEVPVYKEFTDGNAAPLLTVPGQSEVSIDSITISNRETSQVRVQLFDAASGSPTAANTIVDMIVPAGSVLSLSGQKGYLFTTAIRGIVTTASTGVDISLGCIQRRT